MSMKQSTNNKLALSPPKATRRNSCGASLSLSPKPKSPRRNSRRASKQLVPLLTPFGASRRIITLIIVGGKDFPYRRPYVEFKWRDQRLKTKAIRSSDPDWNEKFLLLYCEGVDEDTLTLVIRGKMDDGFVNIDIPSLREEEPIEEWVDVGGHGSGGLLGYWVSISKEISEEEFRTQKALRSLKMLAATPTVDHFGDIRIVENPDGILYM
eukprot:Selendium_serpulae@DN8560_c0_g1_i1.p1